MAKGIIEVKQNILTRNHDEAENLRAHLTESKTKLINVMASPGSGKTTTILATINRLKDKLGFAVIEGDIESQVDSNKVKEHGVTAVQINTGGACHLDVPMIRPAIELIDLESTDVVFVENIGNLVCPAEFDIGEALKVMILSVPEGDDKVLKYPMMFSIADVLIVNKTDYLALPTNNFDVERLRRNVLALNPDIDVFEMSSLTGDGVEAWCSFLEEWARRIRIFRDSPGVRTATQTGPSCPIAVLAAGQRRAQNMTEKEKMLAGVLYDANYDEELNAERLRCKDLCFDFNSTRPSDAARQDNLLLRIVGSLGENCRVTAPFWCDYGYNIRLGDRFYANHNCVILDAAPVTFGNDVYVGPDCGFYTSGHPLDAKTRNAGLEYAHPITVGNDVWIGGGVRVMPGVTIGNNVVIGSGSIVTKDVPSGVVAAGNPCRVLRALP